MENVDEVIDDIAHPNEGPIEEAGRKIDEKVGDAKVVASRIASSAAFGSLGVGAHTECGTDCAVARLTPPRGYGRCRSIRRRARLAEMRARSLATAATTDICTRSRAGSHRHAD